MFQVVEKQIICGLDKKNLPMGINHLLLLLLIGPVRVCACVRVYARVSLLLHLHHCFISCPPR